MYVSRREEAIKVTDNFLKLSDTKITALGYILTSLGPKPNKICIVRWIKEVYDRTMPFDLIPDCFKTQGMCVKVVEKDPWWLKDVPGKFKTHEIYDKAVRSDPNRLRFSPVHIKIQEICNEAIKKEPWMLEDVPDHFKKQKKCEKAVEKKHVPDYFKRQEMCNDVAEKKPYALEYVLDLFVTQQQIKILQYDNDDWYDNDLIEWYDGYKKRKVQKINIKEELMPITWHPSRWWD